MKRSERQHLRLVVNSARRAHTNQYPASQSQTDLFHPLAYRDTLLLFNTWQATEKEFKNLVAEVRPRAFVDLRVSPTFAFDSLTRPDAFQIFRTHSIAYFDILGLLGVESSRNSVISSGAYTSFLFETLSRELRPLYGPVVILLETARAVAISAALLSTHFPLVERGWQIQELVRHSNRGEE